MKESISSTVRVVQSFIKEHDRNTVITHLVRTDNVFLFVPNIIDYIRVVLLVLFAVNASLGHYQLAAVCYFTGFVLDELDGNAARYLGQTSVFGMMLDVLIDEASVLCLCSVLGILYPQYVILFQLYTALDLSAQWSHYQYSALYKNNNMTAFTDDWIMDTYFNNYWLMLCWVYGNHIFLLMLYLCNFTLGPQVALFGMTIGVWKLLAYITAPWSLSRLGIMVYLLVTSLGKLAARDQLKRTNQSRNK